MVDDIAPPGADLDARLRHGDALSTLEHGLHVLEYVAEHEDVGPKEIAAALGLPIGTTYHLVNTLLDEGYLFRVGLGDIVLGEAVGALAGRFGHRPDPYPELRAVLDDLAERSGEVAAMGRLLGRQCVITAVSAARAACHGDHIEVGDRGPAHTMALGKVLVANLDPRYAMAVFGERRLEQLTDRTTTRIDDLLRDLETARARGWAVDVEEGEPGLCCIAARIVTPTGRPPTAIAVAIPPDRLRTEPGRLITLVTSAARRCSAILADGNEAAVHASAQRDSQIPK